MFPQIRKLINICNLIIAIILIPIIISNLYNSDYMIGAMNFIICILNAQCATNLFKKGFYEEIEENTI